MEKHILRLLRHGVGGNHGGTSTWTFKNVSDLRYDRDVHCHSVVDLDTDSRVHFAMPFVYMLQKEDENE